MRIVYVAYLVFAVPIRDDQLPTDIGIWFRSGVREITMSKTMWLELKDSLPPHSAKQLGFESDVEA